MYQSSISKDEINLLPIMEFEGEIIEIVTLEGALKALDLLKEEPVLGFDTETRPSFKKGESYLPALLQLATSERAFIFRLKFFEPPEEMFALLSNPKVLKVGVGIADDLNALQKLRKFKPEGFQDLSLMVRKLGFTSEGLRALTGIFLGKRLLKGAKVTNWEKPELSPAQIKYAGTDAVVGLLIYQKIIAL